MALVNSGFDGTVDEASYAYMWALGGQDAVESDAAWKVTQGTGRQVSVATSAGYAFAKGVLSKDASAAATVALGTPTNGAWNIIYRRINWATNTVSVVAVAHSTTSTTVPVTPPSTFTPPFSTPGVQYDQPLAWAWVNSVNTNVLIFDLRRKPLELGVRADFQLDNVNQVRTVRTQVGIGKIVGTGANSAFEDVTFPTPFSSLPAIQSNFIGAKSTGSFAPTSLNAIDFGTPIVNPIRATTSGFRLAIYRPDNTMTTDTDYYYSWTATGEV